MVLQKLFVDCQDVGDLMYSYLCRRRDTVSSGLNVTDYVAGVHDIVDLGGESNPMDFYFSVFSVKHSLTQSSMCFVLILYCKW